MIIYIAALIGAACGALLAKKRKGNIADMLQHAAVLAIIFTVVAMFYVVLTSRAG